MVGEAPRVSTDFTPIAVADFQERTGIDLRTVPDYEKLKPQWIVSPRDLASVSEINVMTKKYLYQLLGSIGVAYDRTRKVYKECEVHIRGLHPSNFKVGQKFVYRKNYISIVEGLRNIFKGFLLESGFTRFLGCWIMGETEEGISVLAHYLPPIVEQHGAKFILMDGVHRSYLARQAGADVECLLVEGVHLTFPCAPHEWKDVQLVDEKPPNQEDRFWDLDRNLFRDLKYVGIDG